MIGLLCKREERIKRLPGRGLRRHDLARLPEHDAALPLRGGHVHETLVGGAAPFEVEGVLRLYERAVHQHVGLREEVARRRVGHARGLQDLMF